MPGRSLSTVRIPYWVLVMPSSPVSSRNSDTAICCARRMRKPGRWYSSAREFWGDGATLLPSAIGHHVLIGRAGRNQAPAQGPLIIVVEAVARIGHRRRVQHPRQLEVSRRKCVAGFFENVMRIFRRILVDRLGGARLGSEHLCQRRTIKLVSCRLAARRMALDQHAAALRFGDADPGFLPACGFYPAGAQTVKPFFVWPPIRPFDLFPL